MVAAARQDRECAERRSEQLRAQLNDTETLLVSHQEQLAELKLVMQQMSSERDDTELHTNASTAPSTPGLQTRESMSKIFDAFHQASSTSGGEDVLPAPPTSFTHLLHPVLRTDLHFYDDFHSLLQMSRKSSPQSRVTSASYGGLNVVGLGNAANREVSLFGGHHLSNGSTSSLATSSYQSSPVAPAAPVSTNSSVSSKDVPLSNCALKDTRFYKRVLTEDIEPTLRLDTAPGLSWLVRRTVINSICEGTLIVEPSPLAARHFIFACSLCGENRSGDEFTRTHRFRTSENENAQKYPLCIYCHKRVRASCDFLGFLRMVKDGHWRTDGVEAEALAWEECVKLREAMFWSRIGGGVIPSFVRTRESPRTSVEDKDRLDSSELDHVVDSPSLAAPENPSRSEVPRESIDLFGSNEKRVSIGKTRPLRRSSRPEVNDSWETFKADPIFEDNKPGATNCEDAAAAKQLRENLLKAQEEEEARTPALEHPLTAPNHAEQNPANTIPGAFDF